MTKRSLSLFILDSSASTSSCDAATTTCLHPRSGVSPSVVAILSNNREECLTSDVESIDLYSVGTEMKETR